MDRHYLSPPLFHPRSVAVFAHPSPPNTGAAAEQRSPRGIHNWLTAQAFAGSEHAVDMQARSSLSDLAPLLPAMASLHDLIDLSEDVFSGKDLCSR